MTNIVPPLAIEDIPDLSDLISPFGLSDGSGSLGPFWQTVTYGRVIGP